MIFSKDVYMFKYFYVWMSSGFSCSYFSLETFTACCSSKEEIPEDIEIETLYETYEWLAVTQNLPSPYSFDSGHVSISLYYRPRAPTFRKVCISPQKLLFWIFHKPRNFSLSKYELTRANVYIYSAQDCSF